MRYRFCPSVRARAPKRRFPAPSLLTSSPRPHFRSPLKLCLGARGPIQTRHHASPTHAHLRSRPPIGGRATWTWNQTDRQRERERLWRGKKRERERERRPPRARSGEPQRLLLFQLSTFAALLFLSPPPYPAEGGRLCKQRAYLLQSFPCERLILFFILPPRILPQTRRRCLHFSVRFVSFPFVQEFDGIFGYVCSMVIKGDEEVELNGSAICWHERSFFLEGGLFDGGIWLLLRRSFGRGKFMDWNNFRSIVIVR